VGQPRYRPGREQPRHQGRRTAGHPHRRARSPVEHVPVQRDGGELASGPPYLSARRPGRLVVAQAGRRGARRVRGRAMIRTSGLTKRFGPVLAVDGVDVGVKEGDRYGLLGPNGSGKTTLVRMLLGLVYATSGEIEVMGEPVPRRVAHVLPRIGALVEGPGGYGHLSGRTNLALFDAAGPRSTVGGRSSRRRRIDAVLERVGLGSIDNRPVKAYSLGMRQRLGLAAALLRSPALLILDEPTNGLDPRGIREIRDLLVELNEAGTTVFLSSHLLSEVEQLCTTGGVMDQGALVIQDELA